jgi:hypothetical protein
VSSAKAKVSAGTKAKSRPATARKAPLLSKEQRAEIEKQLNWPWGQVELTIDGHAVLLQVQRYTALRYVVTVYVDGKIRGEDRKSDSPIGAKFFRPETVTGVSKKQFASYQKLWGIRAARELKAKYTSVIHMPYFRSARGFLTHVQRTCDRIEVVSIGHQPKPENSESEATTCSEI